MTCSKFITFAVTKTTKGMPSISDNCCDLLKIHYLCGDKDNLLQDSYNSQLVVICSKFITFAVTKTTSESKPYPYVCCDLLKIHYLCGDKDNCRIVHKLHTLVVICSKFITFAVTKTTSSVVYICANRL